jgi:beta-phosphoglucomutase-like phosphatase (HAD superfamily)
MTEFKAEKIFFDMDGVLADFSQGVRELCNFEPQPINDDNYDKEQDDLMWFKIRAIEHFYDHLKFMPGAEEMFHAVYDKYGSRCEILTGVPKERRGIISAGSDKISWMRRMLASDITVNIVNTEDKPQYCCGKGYILIDDMQNNIAQWEAAGGTGIVHVSASQTLAWLKSLGVL